MKSTAYDIFEFKTRRYVVRVWGLAPSFARDKCIELYIKSGRKQSFFYREVVDA